MPTVVDELVVRLGLDSTQFRQGAASAEHGLRRVSDTAIAQGKNIEAAAGSAAEFFGRLRTEILGVAAALLGISGLEKFVSDTTRAEATTGRLAHNIGMTTGALSAWEGAAQRAGGSADATAQSFAGLQRQFQQFRLTGHSNVVNIFRFLGVRIADAEGHARSLGAVMLDLADKFHGMSPERASTLGGMLGLDQGTINLLEEGRGAVQRLLDQQRQLGVISDQDASAGIRLQNSLLDLRQSASSLGRAVLTDLDPALTKVIKGMTDWVTQNRAWLSSDIEQDVRGIASTIGQAGKQMTTWHGTAELVAAYFAGPFAIAMMAGLGPVAAAVAAIVAGLALMDRSKTGLDPSTWAVGSPLWAGMSQKEQSNYLNSPRSQAFLNPLGNNPNKFHWWNPGSWLGHGSVAQKGATLGQNLLPLVPGLSPRAAAGIASNAVGESTLNPSAINPTSGALGLWQFLGRNKSEYLAYAKAHNANPADYATQVAFMSKYLRDHPRLVAAMNAAPTPEAAAAVFEREYERPGAGHMASHVAAAGGIYAAMTAPHHVAAPSHPELVAGAGGQRVSTSTTHNAGVEIGTLNVTAPGSDPKAVAQAITDELTRYSFTTQANTGLR